MRTLASCGLFVMLAAAPSAAQVQVDVRLEKSRYIAGEPVVVLIEVRNVGSKPVGYSTCDGNVRLEIVGTQRRRLPNIFGCFWSATGGVIGCAVDPPPQLQPSETTTFKYVLSEYDLGPGTYQLSASGKAGVRGINAPFERTLPLEIIAGTETELRAAFATLVSEADASDGAQRHHARAAIIASAPPFLELLIARFAAEDSFDVLAIDALARIGSPASRTQLRELIGGPDRRRETATYALSRVGHPDDTDFLAGVLRDERMDDKTRQYAALGLGHIGGDTAAQQLALALDSVPSDLRPWVATALGNTRSRAAVPVLIGMFGNNPSRNNVCGALRTLTHRSWCGSAEDPVATRRQWLRSWKETGSTTPIFGPNSCDDEPAARTPRPPAAPESKRPDPTVPPRVTSVVPKVASPNSAIDVSGYALGLEDSRTVRIIFRRGTQEHSAKVSGSGRALSPNANTEFQYMDLFVPADVTPGPWELVIDANGRRSAPVAIEITDAPQPELSGISPRTPHPAQGVILRSKAPVQIGDHIQLTDARGRQWRLSPGLSSLGFLVTLPDEVVDGEASVQLVRRINNEERLSAPLKFVVTSGPLPLSTVAVSAMRSVAPGESTDLGRDREVEFEVYRADRIDVEFTQDKVAAIVQTTGPEKLRLEVPADLKPGRVTVRTRTWIEQTASAWSAPSTYTVAVRP